MVTQNEAAPAPQVLNIYEISNPSDALTMRAPSILIAGLAVLLLGQGSYGAKGADGQTPVVLGWDAWLAQHKLNENTLMDAIDKHEKEIAEALASVLLGKPADRPDVEAALAGLADEPARRAYIKARNHRMRSSMSDIEDLAHRIADRLRG